jgi:hypothetical protein
MLLLATMLVAALYAVANAEASVVKALILKKSLPGQRLLGKIEGAYSRFAEREEIERLKAKVAHYSPHLKQAIIKNFLWSARFTLDNASKPASRGEVYIVTGCLARAIHCLVQVLYAINETYYLSEKKLAADLGSFSLRPEKFLERISTLLGATGTTSAQLQESLAQTEALYNELATLGKERKG